MMPWLALPLALLLLQAPPGAEAQAAAAQAQAAEGLGFRLQQKMANLTPLDVIRQFEAEPETIYHLGEGDEITVDVWGRPELSGKHIVGPDGYITIPLIGARRIAGLSRVEAPALLADALKPYYAHPSVTLRIDRYVSNRIYILGRVQVPGALQFEGQPTLLDVITRAGALPIGGGGAEKAALNRCAIFRGRDQILWVDLKQILSNGNLAYNIRLRREDIVYIPDSDDQLIYVLGEAMRPGAFHLTPSMSLIDALALAGGPNENASKTRIHLIRPRQNIQTEFNLKDALALKQNPAIALEEGDIVYLSRSRMGNFGYILSKVSPLTSFAIIATVVKP